MRGTGRYNRYAPYVIFLRKAVDTQQMYERLEDVIVRTLTGKSEGGRKQ